MSVEVKEKLYKDRVYFVTLPTRNTAPDKKWQDDYRKPYLVVNSKKKVASFVNVLRLD